MPGCLIVILADLIVILCSYVISFPVKGALMAKALSRERIPEWSALIDRGSWPIINWLLIDSGNISAFVDAWAPTPLVTVGVHTWWRGIGRSCLCDPSSGLVVCWIEARLRKLDRPVQPVGPWTETRSGPIQRQNRMCIKPVKNRINRENRWEPAGSPNNRFGYFSSILGLELWNEGEKNRVPNIKRI